jgi:NAD+ kinase
MQPPSTIQRIGIISRPRRTNLAEVVPPLLLWLEQRGLTPIIDTETAGVVKTGGPGKTRDQVAEESELMIVLGGDGTLLAAAREAAPRGVPLLPINMGSLGFLTSFTVDELYPALESALSGEVEMEERILLMVERRHDERLLEQQLVLNEAVIHKGALARMIEMELHIDKGFVWRRRRAPRRIRCRQADRLCIPRWNRY